MKYIALFAAFCLPLLAQVSPPADTAPLRAKHIFTVSDDFVVDIFHNGKRIADSQRKLISESYGASSEQIFLDVHQGDWIVFNVVNNRMRWQGARYFAVAGMMSQSELSFASKLDSPNWVTCDNPSFVSDFITNRVSEHDNPTTKITKLWDGGDPGIKKLVGSSWNGDPIWGQSSNTWIKVRVE